MEKSDYTNCFGAPFPCPNHLEIYDKYNKSIAKGAAGVIRAKAKAIHRARITEWDALKAAERSSKFHHQQI